MGTRRQSGYRFLGKADARRGEKRNVFGRAKKMKETKNRARYVLESPGNCTFCCSIGIGLMGHDKGGANIVK
jgi:hypothetical protein